jgi:hypothetical protein
MSLEKFLSYRAPSRKKILHDLSVDLEWNTVDAYDLMEHVSGIMLSIEKNKRYAELNCYLEKKETYLALHKELGELMDKHNFKKRGGRYAFLEYEDEAYGDQTVLHYWDYLKHADMLVARDNAWRYIFHSDDY